MKNLFKVLFSILLACFGLLTPFMSVNFSNAKAVALAVPTAVNNTTFTELMRDCRITQDGYVFSENDFEIKYNADKTNAQYYLYVNTAITITNVTRNYDIQITLSNLGDHYTTNEKLDVNESFSIAMGNTETIKEISLYQWFLAGGGGTFKFYLVQTPVNFKVNPLYQWNYSGKPVIAPSPADSYLDQITLTGINGTENSPIYVDFYYNGEFYSLYNVNGIYYNTITNNRIQQTELVFNVPGQYELYLYDKTCYKALKSTTIWEGTDKETTFNLLDTDNSTYSSYANREYFAFSVQQSNANLTADNMYIIAKDDNGETIVSNQTVNSSVHIKFYNLDVQVVGKIEVLKYYSSLTGTNIPTTEVLYPGTYSKLVDLSNSTITYTDDSSYAINVYDKQGNPIWSNNFKFTILNDIHNAYGKLSSTKPEYVPRVNEVFPIEQTESHDTSFKGFTEVVLTADGEKNVALQSSTTTYYTVRLARASCSIDGISNGESVNDPVKITVNGVDTLKVDIYIDGVLAKTRNVKTGTTFEEDAVGNYKIVATDEMGTVLTKSFTINRSLNAATIALIIFGSLGLVVFLIMVIRTRTKIKVR